LILSAGTDARRGRTQLVDLVAASLITRNPLLVQVLI